MISRLLLGAAAILCRALAFIAPILSPSDRLRLSTEAIMRLSLVLPNSSTTGARGLSLGYTGGPRSAEDNFVWHTLHFPPARLLSSIGCLLFHISTFLTQSASCLSLLYRLEDFPPINTYYFLRLGAFSPFPGFCRVTLFLFILSGLGGQYKCSILLERKASGTSQPLLRTLYTELGVAVESNCTIA